jgi:transcription elongation factor GreA
VDTNVMTAAGLEALQAEVDQLESTGRAEIAAQIKTAREWGDLKENGEYHAAKEAQAHLETRILQLRQKLLTAEVVEVSSGDIVDFGSSVEVEDEATGKRVTYELVSSLEASAGDGRLSFDSPVAVALRGQKVGGVAVVRTPRGERRLRVVKVS